MDEKIKCAIELEVGLFLYRAFRKRLLCLFNASEANSLTIQIEKGVLSHRVRVEISGPPNAVFPLVSEIEASV